MAEQMRFVGICSSPRRDANTQVLVENALEAAEETIDVCGCDTSVKLVSLAGRKVHPCLGCDQCVARKSYCILKDDWMEVARPLFDPMPDGVVFGSPVYFFNQNAIGRAYMERCTCLLKGIWDKDFPYPPPDWSATAAGAVAVGYDRNGGVEFTLTAILQWFLVMGFVTVGGFYLGGAGWTGMRPERQAVLEDRHSLEAARLVGRRVAKTALLLRAGKEALGDQLDVDDSWQNFISMTGGGIQDKNN